MRFTLSYLKMTKKVMTPNQECATIDTPIVDALCTMHDGKFLLLPMIGRDGIVVATVDVIHIIHVAVVTTSQVGKTANLNNEAANSMIQKFWDLGMALTPNDEGIDLQSALYHVGQCHLNVTGLHVFSQSMHIVSLLWVSLLSHSSCTQNVRPPQFKYLSLAEVITSIIHRDSDDIDPQELTPNFAMFQDVIFILSECFFLFLMQASQCVPRMKN
ncbi:hypothetical protein VNO77_00592 [Canavalia gladiata]|uniref:CBS domain-containing protein n=1 Tax=Canavalia gladiata TaxID=3824 RepID=A0AAN9R5G2_CANGL